MNTTPLNAITAQLSNLAATGQPLSLDGYNFNALPDRQIPITELPTLLMKRGVSMEDNDQVWAHLITCAQADPNIWLIAAIFMAEPGLRKSIRRAATQAHSGLQNDLESAAIEGATEAILSIDITQKRLCWTICKMAFINARRCANQLDPKAEKYTDQEHEFDIPDIPNGHEDLLLIKAVSEQIITTEQATLIGDTRLDRKTLQQTAEKLGITRHMATKKRTEAETKLHIWLRLE